MAKHEPEQKKFFFQPESIPTRNQSTASQDSIGDDMAADLDEPSEPPPGRTIKQKSMSLVDFRKSTCVLQKQNSLLTRILHTSESDSHVDEDDSPFFEVSRAQSSASTHSRGSVASMCDLTSDGHTSPTRTNSPSPSLPPIRFTGLPHFSQEPFKVQSTGQVQIQEPIAPNQRVSPKPQPNEQNVEAGLGRKRCITFACGGRAAPKAATPPKAEPAEVQPEKAEEPPKRKCSLKFVCPTRENAPAAKPHVRLSSPPPPSRRSNSSPKSPATIRSHRGSDATVRNNSPKLVRKASSTIRPRRESGNSDVSLSEATRFHEFAGSDDDVADWTQESTCYRRRLTVDDTLSIEHKLRKLGREVEEEEEAEVEEAEEEDEAIIDDDEDEDEDDYTYRRSLTSSGHDSESDDGFQTDDEHGFAHSDDDSDGDSDYDWWAPGRSRDNLEHIRPTVRRNSESSIASRSSNETKIVRRRKSRALDIQHPPELPDSTDFVCGTLDEDKPLEQAWITHMKTRRDAKHKTIPQDIDPTFPASDPEIDDEEDEVSETYHHSDSDQPGFIHGKIDMHDDNERKPRSLVPRKRSPLHSPKRLRSPPPTKRLHRSPPPRRHRSPAPFPCLEKRISSSVPRNQEYKLRSRKPVIEFDAFDEDTENTPRFRPARRAIDIVKGLEKKRQRRREKLAEKYCRKPKTTKEKKPAPGKGCERMREMGLELNAYRGKKNVTPQEDGEVHMLSY